MRKRDGQTQEDGFQWLLPHAGPRSRSGDHRRRITPRAVGAHFLLRVRRPPAQAGAGEGDWGISMKFPCPACGYKVFDEPAGSYDICGVCGWEDDPVQLRYPCTSGGANKQSLWEWQKAVLGTLSLETQSERGLQRCSDWRPLEEKDCQDSRDAPTSGVPYFESASGARPLYYWNRT